MTASVKEYIESVVDMDYAMDTWNGPPSLHVIWEGEELSSTDLRIPDAIWEIAPPAFVIFQLTAQLVGNMPITEGIAQVLLQKGKIAALVMYTEAWGLPVNADKGENFASKRGEYNSLAEHPDAYEFKAALAISVDGTHVHYQRARNADTPPQEPGGPFMMGPIPLAMEALVKVLDFAKREGRMVLVNEDDHE